jgi:D-beta-D-heptose 7-phosphate kinase/D-beta-D-heptose 1-phosphate adenosyltransferase
MSRKTVLTFGAFDLIHPGHIRFLKRARALGDYLVVALVADEAINIVKGNGKPIIPLNDRVEIMEHMKSVDRVMTIDTYNPVPAMEELERKKIKVDVLVKGNDWEYIPGCEHVIKNGGKLVKLSYSDGFSTSDIIRKIRGSATKS